jgi:ATP-dependent Zn protease
MTIINSTISSISSSHLTTPTSTHHTPSNNNLTHTYTYSDSSSSNNNNKSSGGNNNDNDNDNNSKKSYHKAKLSKEYNFLLYAGIPMVIFILGGTYFLSIFMTTHMVRGGG